MSLHDSWLLIQNRTFEELIGSKDVLILIDLASKLLYNGAQIPTCTSCLKDYYLKLKNLTFEQVELKINSMKKKNQKYMPKWVGIKYVKGALYNSRTITDEHAEEAIKHGYLTEKDFEINDVESAEVENEKTDESIEISQKKRGRKKQSEE